MNTLKWKSRPISSQLWRSEARAAAPIRGRYRISYYPRGLGKSVKPFFETRFVRDGGSVWRNLGMHRTIHGARWLAEQDHAERLCKYEERLRKREGAA
jgi:hypothetical protein